MSFIVTAHGKDRQRLDLAEMRRALSVLADPEHYCELRGLPQGASRVVAGCDLDGLCRAADQLADCDNLYYGLNPVGAIGRAANDADTLKRRWLLLDIDPIRSGTEKETSATDAEKDNARALAETLIDYLSGLEWPAPLLVDSGNGWHVLYRIDLPNDEHTKALIKRLLYSLAERFDTPNAGVDRRVYNASRIAKLPGTTARKGRCTDERPHRPCVMVHCPHPLGMVTPEQIAAAGAVEKGKPLPTANRLTVRASNGDGLAYGRAALQRECVRVLIAKPGPEEGRNNALNTAAFKMGQLVAGGCISRQEVEAELAVAASKAGLGDSETRATIRSGLTAGLEVPRQPKEREPEQPAATAVPDGATIIVRASSIQPRVVEWLWPGRIPLGKLTTFAGVGGLGKTFCLLDIAARVSRGSEWPGDRGECAEPGQVLIVSGEDDPDDTLVPRMIELGADLNRVAFLRTEVLDKFQLSDLETLDRAIDQIGPGVRFVAIDPPTAYLGDVDDHKNAELRSLLSPMKSWASKRRVAVVFNTHVNKNGAKVEAMMRVMGSVAWVNAVRAAHMFAKDPDDPTRRLFVPMKLNIGKERKGLAYRIVETSTLAKVEWLGEVDTTADEAVNKETREVKASEWLAGLYAGGRQEIPSDEIWSGAKELKISRNAVKEAKTALGIKPFQRGGQWIWPAPKRPEPAVVAIPVEEAEF